MNLSPFFCKHQIKKPTPNTPNQRCKQIGVFNKYFSYSFRFFLLISYPDFLKEIRHDIKLSFY